MTAAVIVPFRNNCRGLRRCLLALADQTCRPKQVLAINNGSDENVDALIVAFPGVTWLKETGVGSYAARNLGLRNVNADVVAFTDSDCLPRPTWLEAGVARLRRGDATIVGGRIEPETVPGRPLNACEVIDETFMTLFRHRDHIERRRLAVTANLLVCRGVFDEVGPFDQSLRSGGDTEWVGRAVSRGHRLSYEDRAVVQHPRRSSFGAVVARGRRVSGGLIALFRRQPNAGVKLLKFCWRLSPLNPRIHGMALTDPRIRGARRRMAFILALEAFSAAMFVERIRVLAGGEPRRE